MYYMTEKKHFSPQQNLLVEVKYELYRYLYSEELCETKKYLLMFTLHLYLVIYENA